MVTYTNKKTVKDFYWLQKSAIVRCDFNVPLDQKTGEIVDDARIRSALPTLLYILKNGGRAILLSHLGRVKTVSDRNKYSLKPIAKRLQSLLADYKVTFVPQTRGHLVDEQANKLKKGEILLLENTRFEDLDGQKESNCDPDLANYWNKLGDIFVNDAFGTIHRNHASTVGIAHLSDHSCVGILVEEEIFNLQKAIINPARPLLAIIGGSKISDKIDVIENLLGCVDYLIIGGAMVFNFNVATGIKIGDSFYEKKQVDKAQYLIAKYGKKIILPADFLISPKFENTTPKLTKDANIPDGYLGLDVGSKSIEIFRKIIMKCHTIIWNGPLGVCEFSNYRKGTLSICESIYQLRDVYSVAGGGDSIAAIKQLGYIQNFSHISTGGGALLTFYAGKKLAVLEEIEER